MVAILLSWQFILLYVWLSAALFVHFRGKVRHDFGRQLGDHSTFLAPYNALVYLTSGVKNRPFLDLAEFPALAPLRDGWETIRDEARVLLDDGHIRAAEKKNDIAFNTFFRRGWKRFYLKWYGDVLPSARALCPRTVELVESIPSVNAALFALLPAGSRLGAHRDPFAGSLRYHLGLLTPDSDACSIDVDGTRYAWRDGEDVLFDETYIHAARNETDRPRVILFCDVARPIRFPSFRAVNRFVTRFLARATASHNVESEKIGVVNRLASTVYRLKRLFQRLKKIDRTSYYAVKYALLLGLAFLVFVFPWL